MASYLQCKNKNVKCKKIDKNIYCKGPVGAKNVVFCKWLATSGVGGTQNIYIYNTLKM